MTPDDTPVAPEFPVDRTAPSAPTRRQILAGVGAAGAAAALAKSARALAGTHQVVERAAAARAAGSDLGAVEHVVFLMMENRSYDHYFGTYEKGRGFDDHPAHRLGRFAQAYPAGTQLDPPGVLLPFHLRMPRDECTRDLTHNWGPMHKCWNHGKMNHWVKVHTSDEAEGNPRGALTMGYYTRKELAFYYSLADHFTLGDAYFSSILGPTHPNRSMQMTGTIDPGGIHGGPMTDTSVFPSAKWACTWPTAPELLEEAGVSWKVYHPSSDDVAAMGTAGTYYQQLTKFPIWQNQNYDPANAGALVKNDNVLLRFAAYQDDSTTLHQKAFNPTFPTEFYNDVQADTLPAVSWIIPPLGFDEHASASPRHGMWFTEQLLKLLTSNPAVWSKTVVFLMHDENDGMFDHVSPPTAPAGTSGEYLTADVISAQTDGIRGPLGLGIRVPLLVISPFSRGGRIASEVFDHTSQLQFLEQRFGIEVSNISAWRRKTVGDLTSTLFQGRTRTGFPTLDPAPELGEPLTSGPCAESTQEAEINSGSEPTLPVNEQRMPTQDGRTIAAHRFRDVP